MIPVKVEQLVAAVGGELLTGSGNQLIKEVIIDSREKAEDGLFVPIIGEKTDGHKYVAGALSGGAKTLFMQKESAYKEEILASEEFAKTKDYLAWTAKHKGINDSKTSSQFP